MMASVYFSVYLNTAGGPAQSGSEVVCDTCSIVFLSVYLNVVTVEKPLNLPCVLFSPSQTASGEANYVETVKSIFPNQDPSKVRT